MIISLGLKKSSEQKYVLSKGCSPGKKKILALFSQTTDNDGHRVLNF